MLGFLFIVRRDFSLVLRDRRHVENHLNISQRATYAMVSVEIFAKYDF